MHGDKGGGLREFVQRHRTAQIFRHAQEPGDDRRQNKIRARDPRGANQLPAELAPPEQNGLQLEPPRITFVGVALGGIAPTASQFWRCNADADRALLRLLENFVGGRNHGLAEMSVATRKPS